MGVFTVVLIVLAIFIVVYIVFQKGGSKSNSNLSSANQLLEMQAIEAEKERKRIIELEKAEIKRKKNEERVRLDELVDEIFTVVYKSYNQKTLE